MKKIASTEALSYESLRPASPDDARKIDQHLQQDIDLYYDDQNRVWTNETGGVYIADLIGIEASQSAPAILDAEYVGKCIKTAREYADLSQGGVAEMMGTTQQVISRYECGARAPGMDWMLQFCRKLNMRLSDVFPEV